MIGHQAGKSTSPKKQGDLNEDRPDPLTPADCDLRGFRYMALDVVWLRDSEIAVIPTGDEFRAAVLLWCSAWHQVPAASLPTDDRLLASLAGCGRDLENWHAVKSGALRGFVECSDGRLYHPVVAQKASEAWEKKWDRPDKAAERSEHGRRGAAARWGHKASNANGDARAMPEQCSDDALKGEERKGAGKEWNKNGGGVVGGRAPRKPKPLPEKAEAHLIGGNLLKQFKDAYPGSVTKAAEQKFLALHAAGENVDPIIAAASRANRDMPAEQWLNERAWQQLPLIPGGVAAPKSPPAGTISAEAKTLADQLAQIAGQDLQFIERGWCRAAYRCQQWLDHGWPRDLIVAGVRSMVAANAPEKIGNVNYFDKGLARFIARHSKPVPQVEINQKPEVVHVQTNQQGSGGSALAAAHRLRERVRQERDDRDADSCAVRRLSQG